MTRSEFIADPHMSSWPRAEVRREEIRRGGSHAGLLTAEMCQGDLAEAPTQGGRQWLQLNVVSEEPKR